jgi:hypothetical protein
LERLVVFDRLAGPSGVDVAGFRFFSVRAIRFSTARLAAGVHGGFHQARLVDLAMSQPAAEDA